LPTSHRMVGIGSDLCVSSSPTPLPKQVHLQQAAQDLVQASLEVTYKRYHTEVLGRGALD